jgi:hypothetical protein
MAQREAISAGAGARGAAGRPRARARAAQRPPAGAPPPLRVPRGHPTATAAAAAAAAHAAACRAAPRPLQQGSRPRAGSPPPPARGAPHRRAPTPPQPRRPPPVAGALPPCGAAGAMCRLMAYIGHPMLVADVVLWPDRSIIKQSYDARERLQDPSLPFHLGFGNLNGDGFGIGWFNPEERREADPSPCMFKSITPAWCAPGGGGDGPLARSGRGGRSRRRPAGGGRWPAVAAPRACGRMGPRPPAGA